MKSRTLAIVASILGEEGGIWDDPIGGMTNFGVRQVTLDALLAKGYDFPKDVTDLKMGDAFLIIESQYLADSPSGTNRILELPKPLDNLLAHMRVMSWDNGVRIAQELVGVTVDGICGINTVRALKDDPRSPTVLASIIADEFCRRCTNGYQKSYVARFNRVIAHN